MAVIIKKKPNQNLDNSDEPKTSSGVLSFAINKNIETNPLNIVGIIQELGIRLIFEDLGRDISGYIEYRSNGWVIGINQYQSQRRQRFTLAHELGHYLLHKEHIKSNKLTDRNLFRDDSTSVLEKEANNFASELLMPEDKFKEQVLSGNRELSILADVFEVSVAAIRYRAWQLGYIDRF